MRTLVQITCGIILIAALTLDDERMRQDMAIAALARRNVSLTFDESEELREVWAADVALRKEHIVLLRHFERIRKLEFQRCGVGDVLWGSIQHLTELETLSVFGNPVTDAGSHRLSAFENLTSLDLRGTHISDDTLEHLSNLREVEVINLTGTSITSRGVSHLAELTQLEELSLACTSVDDSGLKHLDRMNKLRFLELEGTEITNEGVGVLPRTLETLTLHNNAGIDEHVVQQLMGMDDLEVLYLCVRVSEASVPYLRELPSLAELYIADVMSAEERKNLEKRIGGTDLRVY